MITPEEAERLATAAVQDYLSACGVSTKEEAGKVLIKLFSMAGLGLVATQGRDRALHNAMLTVANMDRNDLRVSLELVRPH